MQSTYKSKRSKRVRILTATIAIIMMLSMLAGSVIKAFAFNPESDDISEFTQYKNSLLYVQDDANADDLEAYLKCYNKVPRNIIQSLQKAGIKIYILPYNGPEPENSVICATAYPTLYQINKKHNITDLVRYGWITCYTDVGEDYFNPEQLLYTIGLELDYVTSVQGTQWNVNVHGLSDTDEWQSVYNVEHKDELEKVHYMDSLSELNWPLSASDGFADAFRLYLTVPEALNEASPLVYNFIDNVLPTINPDNIYQYVVNSDEASATASSDNSVNDEKEDEANVDVSSIASTEVKDEQATTPSKETAHRDDKRLPDDSLNMFKIAFFHVLREFVSFLPIIIVCIIIFSIILLIRKLKNQIKNKKIAKNTLIETIKHAPVYEIQTLPSLIKQNGTQFGVYIITNTILKVNFNKISDDIYKDAYQEVSNYSDKMTHINNNRVQQMWKIKCVPLPDTTDRAMLQKILDTIA